MMQSIKLVRKITLLTILIILSLSCAKKKMVDFGFITFYYGDIEIIHASKKTTPKLKMILKAGDKVYTKKNSRIDIQLQNFGLIRINQNSEVDLDKVITDVNESIKLGLNNGQILCKILKLKKGQEVEIETPTAVAGVRGTTFLVETDKDKKTSEIAVQDGSVEVADKKEPEKKVIVNQNETVKVDPKTKAIKKIKGIDTKKLKELKAVNDVKIFKNLKDTKVDDLKKNSLKNLKNLNIKDLKGLGKEFKSVMPGTKESSKGPPKVDKAKKKIDDTKAKVDKQKKDFEKKKKETEEKQEEIKKEQKKKVEEAKKKATEDAKKKAEDEAKKKAEEAKKKIKKFKF